MFDISAVVGFQGQVKPPGCRYRVDFRENNFRWQWAKSAARRASVSSGFYDAAPGATQRASGTAGSPHRGPHTL